MWAAQDVGPLPIEEATAAFGSILVDQTAFLRDGTACSTRTRA